MAKEEKSAANKRITKLREKQRALGRKPFNQYVTEEEKIVLLSHLEKMRGETFEIMESVAVNPTEAYIMKDILRLLRLPTNNKAIKGIDMSLTYKIHSSDNFGSYPVVSINLSGRNIKGLDYG